MERFTQRAYAIWFGLFLAAAVGCPFAARAASPTPSSITAAPQKTTLAASVRIRVEEGNTFSWGSGTIVCGPDERCYVLTCGHLFRDMSPTAVTKVDLFGSSGYERVVADVLHFDLDKDVALLQLPVDRPLPSVQLAEPKYQPRPGTRVVSIGCPHGSAPDVQQTQIVSVNKYLGPENLQTHGAPKQGRSGGGLFTADGKLIGVCVAADNQENQGLFMALPVIYELFVRQTL